MYNQGHRSTETQRHKVKNVALHPGVLVPRCVFVTGVLVSNHTYELI
jgi:hypothetical protein